MQLQEISPSPSPTTISFLPWSSEATMPCLGAQTITALHAELSLPPLPATATEQPVPLPQQPAMNMSPPSHVPLHSSAIQCDACQGARPAAVVEPCLLRWRYPVCENLVDVGSSRRRISKSSTGCGWGWSHISLKMCSQPHVLERGELGAAWLPGNKREAFG
jgi:hypothetical protein